MRRIADSADLASEYASADAVVVPIRSGGGTRIKALEAFAHGKPVVATPVGIEGLAVRHGVEALVGEIPAAIAAHCLALMEDAGLRRRLAEGGFEFVRTWHTTDVLERRLAELR